MTPDIFSDKPEGWKFTAVWIADEHTWQFDHWVTETHRDAQRYTYGGIVEHHGYQIESGGWGLRKLEDTDVPSYRAKVRRYRERRWRWLVLDNIDEIKGGW